MFYFDILEKTMFIFYNEMKAKAPIDKNKKCPDDKEVSKKTGNCVKKCTKDQKRNNRTGRCRKTPAVKKTQTTQIKTLPPISLNLLKKGQIFVDKEMKKEKKCTIDRYDIDVIDSVLRLNLEKTLGIKLDLKKSSRNFDACNAIQNAFPSPILLPGWRITKLLGNGNFGVAMGTRGPQNEAGALKILKENKIDLVDSEIEMGNKFHKLGLSPKNKKVTTFKLGRNFYHSIHMDRLDGIIGTYLASNPPKKNIEMIIEKTFMVVKKLSDNNIVHGDLHFDNIGFIHSRDKDEVGKLQVIDHGFAKSGMSLPEIDVLQMLRSTQFMHGITKENAKFIDQKIRDGAKKYFGIDGLPYNMYLQDKLMSTLRKKIGRKF